MRDNDTAISFPSATFPLSINPFACKVLPPSADARYFTTACEEPGFVIDTAPCPTTFLPSRNIAKFYEVKSIN
ncbi:MAG TPA: hypothetical protein IAD11_01385 [Candidatus Stercorousia faecigallinarum]|nr:hypothetical protein [Candidatus Stercorousia faecigallinarum]